MVHSGIEDNARCRSSERNIQRKGIDDRRMKKKRPGVGRQNVQIWYGRRYAAVESEQSMAFGRFPILF